MGSSLSHVMANIFMEYFEAKALNSWHLKPKCWFRFLDDTFIIWKHGRQTLDTFLPHLNNISPHIQFTMEIESNNSLPFSDVFITQLPDGSLAPHVNNVLFLIPPKLLKSMADKKFTNLVCLLDPLLVPQDPTPMLLADIFPPIVKNLLDIPLVSLKISLISFVRLKIFMLMIMTLFLDLTLYLFLKVLFLKPLI